MGEFFRKQINQSLESHHNYVKTPDVFFINEKVSFKHTVTMKNAMFRLLPDGNVIYSVRDFKLWTEKFKGQHIGVPDYEYYGPIFKLITLIPSFEK